MTRTAWGRREPEAREDLLAGLTALGVAVLAGGLTFYVTRTMLARTQLALRPPPPPPEETEENVEEESR